MNDFVRQVDTSGFAIVPSFLAPVELEILDRALPAQHNAGLRNLLDLPGIAELAASQKVRSLVDLLLGPDAFPVRGILFDKTPVANWKVSWHQDLSIAVAQQRDAPGYGPGARSRACPTSNRQSRCSKGWWLSESISMKAAQTMGRFVCFRGLIARANFVMRRSHHGEVGRPSRRVLYRGAGCC